MTNATVAVLPVDFSKRFVEYRRVVFGQPVAKQRIRDPDLQPFPSSATKDVGLNQV